MSIKRLLLSLAVVIGLTTPLLATQTMLSIDPSVPSGDTGTTMANKLNNWRTTLLSLHSGTSRPSYATTGTMWLDTTSSTWAVKVYNGTSDVTVFTIDSTNLRPIFAGAVPWVDGGGAADAITATYSPVIGALTDGLMVGVRATAANATTTPTFQANSTAAKTIVKQHNQPLLAGDISGNSHEILLRYAADIDRWVLLNPAAVAVPDNSVTSAKIVDGAVASIDIADGTVTSTDIANGTIAGTDIASNTAASSNITDGTIALVDLVTALQQRLVPVGTSIIYNGASCPTLYLEENGATVSRTTYSALFAVLSTRFGTGDGSTTFHLPDMRGKFTRGWDHGAGTDPNAASRFACNTGGATGDNVGSCQNDDLESHRHSYDDEGINTVSNIQTGGGSTVANDATGNKNTGFTGGSETRPINVNKLYCIFAGV